jgi:hypothetical protein
MYTVLVSSQTQAAGACCSNSRRFAFSFFAHLIPQVLQRVRGPAGPFRRCAVSQQWHIPHRQSGGVE